jgi:hypothetical protein
MDVHFLVGKRQLLVRSTNIKQIRLYIPCRQHQPEKDQEKREILNNCTKKTAKEGVLGSVMLKRFKRYENLFKNDTFSDLFL